MENNSEKSYRSLKVEVLSSSKIAGRGIFAKEKIKKDEIVAIKAGHLFDKKEFELLDQDCKEYCLQIDDGFYIGPMSKEGISQNAIFINHSCEPNVGFSGQVTYVAMRDIEAGEELVHDYAMCFTSMDHFSDLHCNCRDINCRKKLASDDWKSSKLQQKYGKYFSSYILKKIEQND